MNTSSSFYQIIFYLISMLIAVPLGKRLGVGAVLGYLIVGAAFGPSGFALFPSANSDVLHIAEFGVVMMLFLIGLEVQPKVLWNLRGPIFGLGSLQVVFTSFAFCFLAMAFGLTFRPAIAAGMILSLSSTAIVLQTLQEKGWLKSAGGELSFSVLLFQDIAVIPILALLPLLEVVQPNILPVAGVSGSSGFLQAFKTLAAIALVIFFGKLGVRPLFRVIAYSKLRELFTAFALLLILGITGLMQLVGLSPALGVFLAGVVLANSEYRHQLEADIEPFKGILLAVFFISVGAGIDFALIGSRPILILSLVTFLVTIKALILFSAAKVMKKNISDSVLFSLSLAQGGEFAFVLLAQANKHLIFTPEQLSILNASIALSMFLAPLCIGGGIKFLLPKLNVVKEQKPDAIDEHGSQVLIAGFGRFGQMVSRILRASGFKTTVLDVDAEQVEVLRRFGMKSFFGDASRMDLLAAAGAHQAKLLVVAIDDPTKTTEIVMAVKESFPHLKMFVRVFDRIHAYEIINLGVNDVFIETAGSATNLAFEALRSLGMRGKQALHTIQLFKKTNDRSIRELASVYKNSDQETYLSFSKSWIAELDRILNEDQKGHRVDFDQGWHTPVQE